MCDALASPPVSFVVLLDACVLVPYQLCDVLMRLGEADLFQVLWSEEILAEVERNVVKRPGMTQEKAVRRVAQMRATFPRAAVENYQALTR